MNLLVPTLFIVLFIMSGSLSLIHNAYVKLKEQDDIYLVTMYKWPELGAGFANVVVQFFRSQNGSLYAWCFGSASACANFSLAL